MTLSTAIILVLLAALVFYAVRCVLLYERICQEDEERKRVRVEERETVWNWGPWHPDPAETHLGRTHVGHSGRRAA